MAAAEQSTATNNNNKNKTIESRFYGKLLELGFNDKKAKLSESALIKYDNKILAQRTGLSDKTAGKIKERLIKIMKL